MSAMARHGPGCVVVFHSAEHACAALAAAAEASCAVTLCTAPGAAAYAGPAYLKRLIERAQGQYPAAKAEAVIDCGDDPGLVFTALRAGWKRIAFTGHGEARAKLADIARKSAAEVTPRAPAGLDLATAEDALAACREGMRGSARRRP